MAANTNNMATARPTETETVANYVAMLKISDYINDTRNAIRRVENELMMFATLGNKNQDDQADNSSDDDDDDGSSESESSK